MFMKMYLFKWSTTNKEHLALTYVYNNDERIRNRLDGSYLFIFFLSR